MKALKELERLFIRSKEHNDVFSFRLRDYKVARAFALHIDAVDFHAVEKMEYEINSTLD